MNDMNAIYMYVITYVSDLISIYRCFKNRDNPNPSILIGFSIINHPFWGTPIFGNTHIVYIYSIYLMSPYVSILRLPCPLGFQSATLHESRFACRKQWHFLSAPVTFHRVFRLIRVSLCILDVFLGKCGNMC